MSVGSSGQRGVNHHRRPLLVWPAGAFALLLWCACGSATQSAPPAPANPQRSPDQLKQIADSYETLLQGGKGTAQARTEVQQRLGAVYYLLHRYRDSITVLSSALTPPATPIDGTGSLTASRALEAQSWLVLGLDHSELNELAEAGKALRRALALHADNANARLALGDVLARSGRMRDAEAEYEEQTRLTPSLADAWYKLGLAHSQISAEVSHQKAASAEPGLVVQLSAEELLAKGENLNAARILFRLARSSPEQPEVHADLGTALLRLGYVKSARDHFTQELAHDSESPTAALGFAETSALEGRWEEVAAELERLSSFHPTEQIELMEFPPAGVLMQASLKGDLQPPPSFTQSPAGSLWKSWFSDSEVVARIAQKAESAICAASSREPSPPGFWMTEACYMGLTQRLQTKAKLSLAERAKLTEAEFRLGRYRLALDSANQLHADAPGNGWGIYWLSKAHDAMAEQCFLKVGALNPDSARVHQMLAEHYTKLADYPKAKAEYEDAIRLSPQAPDLHLGLGTVLSRAGELAEAEKELKITVEVSPTSAFAHYQLGHLYVLQSRWPEAILQLQQVPADTTVLLSARLDLAKAESELGQTAEAIQNLLSVSSLDQDGELYFRLAALYRRVGDSAHAHEALATFKQRRSASLDTNNDELKNLEMEQEEGSVRTSVSPE